jgi:hypothetical protein
MLLALQSYVNNLRPLLLLSDGTDALIFSIGIQG